MKNVSTALKSIRDIVPLALVFSLVGLSPIAAQEVDVYFVVGQSNAYNFATNAGTGNTNVGFRMHFARTSNQFTDFPNHTAVAQQFSSTRPVPSEATTILATGLRETGNDIAIFSFARNGAGLNYNMTPDGDPWIWYPGDDPAAGQLFNDSLYANAIAWNQSRLTELSNAGLTPTVKGLFWFQGEKDGRLLDDDVYQANLENLVIRFRQDYGADIPIVVTQIREIQGSYASVNQAAQAATDADPFLAYVETENLPYLSNANNNNVHLTSTGHAQLAPLWTSAMQDLQIPIGDVDRNGSINFLDITPFISLLSNGEYSREADIDRNGDVNFLDITPFIFLLNG